MTLSNEKKLELAFASLTHEFVGVKEGQFPLIKMMAKNDLQVDGFCKQPLLIDPNDYKIQGTKNFMYKRLEKVLLDEYVIDQTTGTSHGEQFKEDYEQSVDREKMNVKDMFEAYKSQILVMYTTKAQKDLFKAFTRNLTDLYKAELLDQTFVNEIVQDVFPDKDWQLNTAKEKTTTLAAKAQKQEEINA